MTELGYHSGPLVDAALELGCNSSTACTLCLLLKPVDTVAATFCSAFLDLSWCSPEFMGT